MSADTIISSNYVSGTYCSRVLSKAMILYFMEVTNKNDLGKIGYIRGRTIPKERGVSLQIRNFYLPCQLKTIRENDNKRYQRQNNRS